MGKAGTTVTTRLSSEELRIVDLARAVSGEPNRLEYVRAVVLRVSVALLKHRGLLPADVDLAA